MVQPVSRGPQRFFPHPAPVHPAFPLDFHKARLDQDTHVFRNRHERHVERRRQVGDRALPGTGKVCDDPPANGMRQRGKNQVDGFGVSRAGLRSAVHEIVGVFDVAAERGNQLRRRIKVAQAHHFVRRMHVPVRHGHERSSHTAA